MGALLTADASRVSAADFIRHTRNVFAPAPTRLRERADASRAFIARAWGKSRAEVDALRAEYEAALAEIDARYALVEVEHLGPGRVAA
jgi:hypothetical protein